MIHRIRIEGTGETYACDEAVHLLAAMELARCRGIPVGCRNGGCGACKIRVVEGTYETRKMNRAVVSCEEEATGCVLACKTYPRGDITVRALGRAWQPATPARSASSSFGFAWTITTTQPDKET